MLGLFTDLGDASNGAMYPFIAIVVGRYDLRMTITEADHSSNVFALHIF